VLTKNTIVHLRYILEDFRPRKTSTKEKKVMKLKKGLTKPPFRFKRVKNTENSIG